MKKGKKKSLSDKEIIQIFKEEEKKTIGAILYFLNQEDCVYTDFLDEGYFENLLYDLLALNILWITSDNRVLLTKDGETLLNNLFEKSVEIDSKKIKFIHYEPTKQKPDSIP